jgi:hypothetical protein
MSRTRRTFGKKLKAVVLEALKRKDTIEVCKKYELLPIKFQCGSRSDTEFYAVFFCRKTVVAK